MEQLWSVDDDDGWLTVREVHEPLARSRDIAYTTVMTVMDRLSKKSLVRQQQDGRGLPLPGRRLPRRDDRGPDARRARGVRRGDRRSALVAFVGEASPEERAAAAPGARRARERRPPVVTTVCLSRARGAAVRAGPGAARVGPRRVAPGAARRDGAVAGGVALAAVLSALGAALVPGHRPRHREGWTGYGVALLALLLTAVVLGRLLLSGHRVGTRIRAVRRRHRDLVDLLATREHERRSAPRRGRRTAEAGVRVLAAQAAGRLLPSGAGRVPGGRLRGHLRPARPRRGSARCWRTSGRTCAARHDLLLEAFTVLHTAFPRFGVERHGARGGAAAGGGARRPRRPSYPRPAAGRPGPGRARRQPGAGGRAGRRGSGAGRADPAARGRPAAPAAAPSPRTPRPRPPWCCPTAFVALPWLAGLTWLPGVAAG